LYVFSSGLAMLCRVFPNQNSSRLKSILDASHGDIVEAIQKVSFNFSIV